MSWHDEYPHKLYASVLLLDNKIINWKIGNRYWDSPYSITMEIDMFKKFPQMKTEWIEYEVDNEKEHEAVFEGIAKEWFKQWKLADDYSGQTPYEED